jgi:hypothetical protein
VFPIFIDIGIMSREKQNSNGGWFTSFKTLLFGYDTALHGSRAGDADITVAGRLTFSVQSLHRLASNSLRVRQRSFICCCAMSINQVDGALRPAPPESIGVKYRQK